MKKWSKRKRWIVGIATTAIAIPLCFFVSLFVIGRFNLFHAHEHCMKNAGLSFRIYAGDHDGKYPFHANGFGDALVAFLKENSPSEAIFFTAPGDDASLLKKCLNDGTDVPEDRCTRMYVQGLNENSNPEIAMIFDRYPTRGGDHFRRPWGPWLREVSLADGSMQAIREKNWPTFQKERELDLASSHRRF